MLHSWRSLKAAKRLIFALSLAVCFLAKTPLIAQALRTDLSVKSMRWFIFNPPKEKGLSISNPFLPLLKSKFTFTKSVGIDYDNRRVFLEGKIGSFSTISDFSMDLDKYVLENSKTKLDSSFGSNLNSFTTKGGQRRSRGPFEFEIPIKFPPLVSKIIGEGGPGLKVSGYRKIEFSGASTWEEGIKSTATSKQTKFPSLKMEQQSKFTISGTIGSKISVQVDQDSKRETDLSNRLHLKYTGDEDEIIQSIEAGNVSLAINSGLVGYSEKVQGLFGIKAQAKIGGFDLTLITSQEKGATKKSEFAAGAETKEMDPIRDYNYIARTFYFLGFEQSLYEPSLCDPNLYEKIKWLPNDFQDGDSIVNIAVYVSNNSINSNSDYRHGLAVVNPDNCDTTFGKCECDTSGAEFEYKRFKPLESDQYFVHRTKDTLTLGSGLIGTTLPYIQLSTSLGKYDVLAVYYQVLRANGDTHTVGNLEHRNTGSTDQDTSFLLKLLKPSISSPKHITWEYEWRNVYSLRTRNIDPDGLVIDIYKGVKGAERINEDKNYQEGKRYIEILGLDQIDTRGNPGADGILDIRQIDFVRGYLVFPDRHPFATDRSFTTGPGDTLAPQVREIYTSNNDREISQASKYYIYVESTTRKTEYSLGQTNIIEGSEVVTLNGRKLTKGEDYDIYYELGQIRFLTNEALDPNAQITVDFEYEPFFMPEKKSLFGLKGDYSLGENTRIGAIALYKSERSQDEKPRVGEEPVKNFVWGTDFSFSLSPPILTQLVDALPLVEAESPSNIRVNAQMAGSLPNPNVRNKAFIDDFEGALEYTDLSIRRGVWTLSSLPDTSLWQRGRMYWYNPYEQVLIQEIWPNKEARRGEDRTNVLSMVFFPKRSHSPIDSATGKFDPNQPESSCNGVMRAFSYGNYDQTRARFLEIWVRGDGAKLHIDLGQISEDIDSDGNFDTEDKLRLGQRDGILDEDEDTGLDGMFNSEEKESFPDYDDPSGDDWRYSDTRDQRKDYTHISGTEGNRDDPDRGRRPDTEDINYNGSLDQTNNYFEFTVDLSADTAIESKYVKGTYSNGWRLYRLPLDLPDSVAGSPDWNNIQFARMWISYSGHKDSCVIQLASIQLVGNRWEPLGVFKADSFADDSIETDESFEIYVINTHENLGYDPPPGVAGVLDRTTKVRAKEQSLVLRFENLKPNHMGIAERILRHKAENYTNYEKIKLWIHGPENISDLEFFFKMGTDSTNYYEYFSEVLPGWNEMEIDFDKITVLKLEMPEGSDTISQMPYRIRGNPTLSKVSYFAMGIINKDSNPAYGEIWVDELGVADVRKKPGFATQGSISFNLADLVTGGNISFSRYDSEFKSLTDMEKKGYISKDYRSSLGISGTISLHKFIPPSWQTSLPLSLSWSEDLSLPKFKTGSDIELPEQRRKDYQTKSVRKSIGFGPRFNKKTDNWFLKLTLKRLNINRITYQKTESTSPNVPVSWTENYGFGASYDLSPGKQISVKPFGWSTLFFIPKYFTQLQLSFLPKTFKVGGDVKGSKSYSLNSGGNITSKYNRDFIGNVNLSMNPLNNSNVNYSFNTTRDIRKDEDLKFSLSPKEAKLGIELRRSQNFKFDYSPQILGFLTNKFSFTSTYNEKTDPQKNYTLTVQNSNTRKFDFTLNLNKLFGSLKTEKGLFKPFNLFSGLMKKIDSPVFNHTRKTTSTVSGLFFRPSLAYQFGLTDKIGVPLISGSLEGIRDASSTNKSYSAKSGVSLYRGVKLSFSYFKQIGGASSSTTPTRKITQTFPDLTLRVSNVERIKLFQKFISTSSFSTSFSKKIDKEEEARTKSPIKKKTYLRFYPLVSLTLNWKNGINTTIKIDKTITEDKDLRQTGGSNTTTKNYETSYSLNTKYSFSAPYGLKIPLLKKIKFRSSVTLNLDISKKVSKEESAIPPHGFNTKNDQNTLTIQGNAGYSFSNQVNGGLKFTWIDYHDKKTDLKRHTRGLGIWIYFKF